MTGPSVGGRAVPRTGDGPWSLVRPVARTAGVLFPDLSGPEQLVCAGFVRGEWVDLRDPATAGAPAGVLRALLLGAGETEPGFTPALRLRGARITGRLDLMGATVRWPLVCEDCEFSAGIRLVESRTRTVRIVASQLAGFSGTRMRLDGILSLSASVIAGPVRLSQARITGQLCLHGTQAAAAGAATEAVAASGLTVDGGAEFTGLVAQGAVALRGATVTGTMDLRGASITSPGAEALAAGHAGFGDLICDGMTVTGTVALTGTRVTGRLQLDRVTLRNGNGEALNASAVRAWELSIRPAAPVQGAVTLSHARVGVLTDDPACWPAELATDGLTYQSLEPRLPARQRLAWLARDPAGRRPQPYQQLAAFYTSIGEPAQARTVRLATERLQRRCMAPLPRAWGALQDLAVGYGYQPWRVVAWLAVLLATGSIVYGLFPPPALGPGQAPHFQPVAYTFELLLPVLGLGQRHAFGPAGPELWFSDLLVAAGWVLVTTVAAAAARALTRR
jgi:hypothetical protein